MYKKIATLLSFFSILVIFNACSDSTSTESAKTTLTGVVVSLTDNSPIAGVYISTVPATTTVLTDSKGRYTISDIPDSTYIIKASKVGYYPNSISVTVADGKTVSSVIQLYDSASANHSPNIPVATSPVNGQTVVTLSIGMSWTCTDPDADNLTYDIYLSTSATPTTLLSTGITTNSTTASGLVQSQTYYWKIVAKDKFGASAESQVYSFKVDTSTAQYLVLNMPLNGSTADLSSNSYSITSSGLSFVADRHGNLNSAGYFNGSSSIIVGNASPLNPTDEITLSCWFKPDADYYAYSEAEYVAILGKWASTGTGKSSYSLTINTDISKIIAEIHDGSSNYGCYSSSNIKTGTWTHLAMTYKNHITKIYLNGILENQKSTNAPQASNYDLAIGRRSPDNSCYSEYFKGAMSDIRIYHKELTAAQVAQIAQ